MAIIFDKYKLYQYTEPIDKKLEFAQFNSEEYIGKYTGQNNMPLLNLAIAVSILFALFIFVILILYFVNKRATNAMLTKIHSYRANNPPDTIVFPELLIDDGLMIKDDLEGRKLWETDDGEMVLDKKPQLEVPQLDIQGEQSNQDSKSQTPRDTSDAERTDLSSMIETPREDSPNLQSLSNDEEPVSDSF